MSRVTYAAARASIEEEGRAAAGRAARGCKLAAGPYLDGDAEALALCRERTVAAWNHAADQLASLNDAWRRAWYRADPAPDFAAFARPPAPAWSGGCTCGCQPPPAPQPVDHLWAYGYEPRPDGKESRHEQVRQPHPS